MANVTGLTKTCAPGVLTDWAGLDFAANFG
jgi:hypothetical protein